MSGRIDCGTPTELLLHIGPDVNLPGNDWEEGGESDAGESVHCEEGIAGAGKETAEKSPVRMIVEETGRGVCAGNDEVV